MKRKFLIWVLALLTASGLGLTGCRRGPSGGSGGGGYFVPPLPFLVDKTSVRAGAPVTGPGGPAIISLTPEPGLDVVEQGGQYTLIFTSNLAGDSIANAALLIEGSNDYYLLDPVVAGNIATATFTINPDYPNGSYTLLLALIGPDGAAGGYLRIILHVAFVPVLEVVELNPLTTSVTPEGRREELLNVIGRAVFSKKVTLADFALRFEDMAGNAIPGRVTLMPSGYAASFAPSTLLQPTTQYQVIADVIGGQSWNNAFWTEPATRLGDTATQVPGRTYSMIIGADNIVEPAAAQLIWGMIGSAVPPFIIMFTDVDPAAGTFSAIGGLAESDASPLVPNTDVPVVKFARDAEFLDPYFLTEPVTITLYVSLAGYDISLPLNDLTLSGKFEPDLSAFTDGKASLSITLEDLRPFIGGFVPIPPDVPVCDALREVVGQEICDLDGKIVMQAEYMVGNYEPGITQLYDLVPSLPAAATEVSATSPIVLDLAGTMELNAEPLLASGWSVQVSATVNGGAVGSFTPGPTLAVAADGNFSGQLTIPPGTVSAGDVIVVHYTCPNMPADDAWERLVEVSVID